MAIVINGSGTVTGISVGGLPDGIVDSGTLATNSVDSAELIDGSIDNSHMAAMAASKLTGALPAISGASLTGLTGSQMPAGSVIQVATDSDGTNISMSTSSWHTTNLSIAFTPIKSDSLIVVTAFLNLYMAGGGTQHGAAQGQLKKDGSDFGEMVWPWCGYGGTEALNVGSFPVSNTETSGSTSARTYSVSVRNYETQGWSSFNQYTGKSILQVWEIAQ